MNLGLVTSYIIGGIILLSIVMMNLSVSKSSNELTITQMTREKASQITRLISHDLQKMGYNRTTRTDPILMIAQRNKIQFRSNIDDSNDNSVEIVTWEITDTEVSSTQNPKDRVLMRRVEDASSGSVIEETPIELGVTEFNVGYFDSYGKTLDDTLATPVTGSSMDNIKQFYVQIGLEAPEKQYKRAEGEGRYVKSVWEKRFSPPNLEEN